MTYAVYKNPPAIHLYIKQKPLYRLHISLYIDNSIKILTYIRVCLRVYIGCKDVRASVGSML